MNLRELKRSISGLNTQQLIRLDDWLHGLIETSARAGGDGLTKHVIGNKTYQSEMVRCGKKGCKCARGELHGPYWYAYWTEGGKTRSEYIGKHLPDSQEKSRRRRVR
jgi:hypothetical protein